MNRLSNTLTSGRPGHDRAPWSNLAYGICSALMPYALATLLLIAFG